MPALDSHALRSRMGRLRADFSTSQLVMSGLLFVIGIVAVLTFVRWASAPSYQVLVSGIDPKDAAAVTAKLQSDGVAYQLQSGGTTILVPAGSVDQERIALAAAGLPKGGTTGWDVFDKQGITSSSFQQQVAYQRALEGQLAQTLGQLDGVQSAQVNLVLPQDQLFTDTQQAARASVVLTTDGTLPDETVLSVQHVIASAVPDLDPAAVTVTDNAGDLLSDQSASGADRLLKRTQAYDDALAAQATSMLDQLLGPGHAVVRVNAQMNTSTQTVDSETYDPKHVVTLQKSSTSEKYSNGAGGGSSGVVSSNPTTSTPAPSAGGGSYASQNSSQQLAASRTVAHTETGPGDVKRLTVSVALDSNAKNAPAAAQVQALVANAVGLDPKRGDTISLTSSSFPIVTTKAPAPAKPSALKSLAGSGMTKVASTAVAIVLLLLVGLGFLRALKRGAVTDIPLDEVAALRAAGRGQLPGGGDQPKKGRARQLPAGPSSTTASHDPAGLATRDPEEMAAVLRNWLAGTSGGR